MFTKILIANRGEIAVRIINTCKRLGITAAAVYADADARGLHRELADKALALVSPGREAYLDGEQIIALAKDCEAQAIHPGYGFLSENADFAQAVAEAGLVFIGPPARALRLLGDKLAAKQLAQEAGLPVIPGRLQPLADAEEACAAAEECGYPVLLKPAAGGGGRGMRVVRNPGEMAAAFAAGRLETALAFGDDRVFLERYIEDPRHIEIQILADRHGKVIHLGERECSIQRRYQKVIEESPSPFVGADLRERMGRAACALAEKAGYVNAGTVEFVVEANGDFHFLEMNARLQVEHPVTEMTSGLDLVEQQLRIAAGEPLPFDQEAFQPKGWAIEARICAEDPTRGFLPSTGMITRYAEPKDRGVRVDSGVRVGSKVTAGYDSLLAKLICRGPDRESARALLQTALNAYHIEGVATNVNFAARILSLEDFVEGRLSTGFIARHFDEGRALDPPREEDMRLAALAATLVFHTRTAALRESMKHMVSGIGQTLEGRQQPHYKCRSGNMVFDILFESEPVSGRNCSILVDGERHVTRIPRFEFFRRRLKLTINEQVRRFRLRFEDPFLFMAFNGIAQVFEVYTPREWELLSYMPEKPPKTPANVLLCPMPGLILEVAAKQGDRVYRGQSLVMLESMKMVSGVPSPIDGVVADVLVKPGQAVEAGDVLARFEN